MSTIIEYLYCPVLGVLVFLCASHLCDYNLRIVLTSLHNYCFFTRTEARNINVIYKNKQFTVFVNKTRKNNNFYVYGIYINDELAGEYNVLERDLSNCYYFYSTNNRYESEVVAIVRAANKELAKRNKANKKKHNTFNEYSYFK